MTYMKELMGDLLSAAGAEVSVIPVVQGDGMPKVELSQLPDVIPILALRNAVLFPGTVYPITIGREKSIRLIEDAERKSRQKSRSETPSRLFSQTRAKPSSWAV